MDKIGLTTQEREKYLNEQRQIAESFGTHAQTVEKNIVDLKLLNQQISDEQKEIQEQLKKIIQDNSFDNTLAGKAIKGLKSVSITNAKNLFFNKKK